jgi:hypothetical protein
MMTADLTDQIRAWTDAVAGGAGDRESVSVDEAVERAGRLPNHGRPDGAGRRRGDLRPAGPG